MNDITDKIAAALTATDTAARALWEAMGSPWTYDCGTLSPSRVRCAVLSNGANGHSEKKHAGITMGIDGSTSVRVYNGDDFPEFEHHGTLDSCRAALAAYLGAS